MNVSFVSYLGKKYAWCLCGQSKSQPLCDGTHKYVHFHIKEKWETHWIECKFTSRDKFLIKKHFFLLTGQLCFKLKKMVTIGFACADRQSIVHFVMEHTKSRTFKRKMFDFIKTVSRAVDYSNVLYAVFSWNKNTIKSKTKIKERRYIIFFEQF